MRDGVRSGLHAAGPQKQEEQDMTDTSLHGALLWPLPAEQQGSSNSRYFIDTEYTDFRHCQLVSLAIVGENGDEFYGERTDFDQARCSDFVRKVVLPQLGQFEGRAMPFVRLREALRAWLGSIPGDSGPVLCYDYETDLNLFRFLLGGPLPRGWRVENIAGRRDRERRAEYFARHGGEHHALHDARANAFAFAG
ncbi:protein of unknown function [Burkholderia sp. OK233]|nr:protein of unknown function [Burkholderia sp. OK233]